MDKLSATPSELHASLYMNPQSESALNDECTRQNLVVSVLPCYHANATRATEDSIFDVPC